MNTRLLQWLTGLLILAGIGLIIVISFRLSQPPPVVSAEAPGEIFSAERAALHLPHIAAVPNPLGSAANSQVRQYIVGQLKGLGLEPQVQMTTWQYQDRVARLGNVIARVKGSGAGQAILFMGHYDSRITAPGASDDGSAVITMLELIRLLKQHPPLTNDLIFLFSDGEESGLLGAQAFMAEHPWTKDIGLVVNFEAMGTSGQSLMFETGLPNLETVREFARAVPYPAGNSLSVEIYKRMPNYTDFEVFKTLGYQGLNFAYIGNSYDYHTPSDNVENIDLRSVQHHGSYAAALALYFGNRSLELAAEQNAVYFNTLGYGFVVYPYSWVPVLTLLALLAAAGVLVMGIRRKTINPGRMIAAFISFVLLLLILFFAFGAIYQIIASFYPGSQARLLSYHQQGILVGLGLLAVSLAIGWFSMILRGVRSWQVILLLGGVLLLLWWGGSLNLLKTAGVVIAGLWMILAHRRAGTVWNLSSGALLLWMIIAGVAGFAVPGASYLFVWPLLFSLVPMGWFLFRKTGHQGVLATVVFLAFAFPVLVWYPMLMHLLTLAMGLPMIGAAMVLAGLMMGLLVPLVARAFRGQALLLNGLVFLAGLVILLLNTTGLNYDARHRQSNAMTYVLEADSGEAFWFSADSHADDWKAQFLTPRPDSVSLSRFFPHLQKMVPATKAPSFGLQAASLEVLSDTVHGQQRQLKVRVTPKSPVTEVMFLLHAPGQQPVVQAGELVHQPLVGAGADSWHRLTYFAPPPEGIILTFFTQPGQPLALQVVEADNTGLPPQAAYQPRPDSMMTAGDRTLITSSYTF